MYGSSCVDEALELLRVHSKGGGVDLVEALAEGCVFGGEVFIFRFEFSSFFVVRVFREGTGDITTKKIQQLDKIK